jgi:hypothetical protein
VLREQALAIWRAVARQLLADVETIFFRYQRFMNKEM